MFMTNCQVPRHAGYVLIGTDFVSCFFLSADDDYAWAQDDLCDMRKVGFYYCS